MRILHVIPYMHPDAGGPPVVVREAARLLTENGHSLKLLTTSLLYTDRNEALRSEHGAFSRVEIIPPRRLDLVRRRDLRETVDALVGESDIVHVHTLWHPLNVVVRRACNRLQTPYVIMPHGMLDHYSLSRGRLKKALYLALVERHNLQNAARIIYTTAGESELAASVAPWLPTGPIIALGGDAPGDPDGSLRETFLRAFPVARGRRCLLFLARIDHIKGLDRIIKALPSIVAQVPETLLLIAGRRGGSYARRIEAEIKAKGLCGSVLWTGFLAGDAKWGAYSASEMFLLPSRHENFAITVAEAMHMARPVVVSDRVNTADHVVEAGAGRMLSAADCERALDQTILALLSDRGGAVAMGVRGQDYARTRLTWENMGRGLLECYRETLDTWPDKGLSDRGDGGSQARSFA